jgi:hypothetical protein
MLSITKSIQQKWGITVSIQHTRNDSDWGKAMYSEGKEEEEVEEEKMENMEEE